MTFPSDPHLEALRATEHLNLRFSIADMDRVEDMVRRKLTPEDMCWEIAAVGLSVTPAEMVRLLKRNGYWQFGTLLGR